MIRNKNRSEGMHWGGGRLFPRKKELKFPQEEGGGQLRGPSDGGAIKEGFQNLRAFLIEERVYSDRKKTSAGKIQKYIGGDSKTGGDKLICRLRSPGKGEPRYSQGKAQKGGKYKFLIGVDVYCLGGFERANRA